VRDTGTGGTGQRFQDPGRDNTNLEARYNRRWQDNYGELRNHTKNTGYSLRSRSVVRYVEAMAYYSMMAFRLAHISQPDRGQQFLPVRCSQTSHLQSRERVRSLAIDRGGQQERVVETYRIPPCRCRKTICVATGVTTLRDIVQRARASRVQEWVQEAEHAFPGRDEAVVQQRDDARENGARAARAVDEFLVALQHDRAVDPRSGDIRKASSGGVKSTLVGVPEFREVCCYGGGLVRGRGKVV
jgi:hypothetical protein